MQSEVEAEARKIYESRKSKGSLSAEDEDREDVRRFEFNESLQKYKVFVIFTLKIQFNMPVQFQPKKLNFPTALKE